MSRFAPHALLILGLILSVSSAYAASDQAAARAAPSSSTKSHSKKANSAPIPAAPPAPAPDIKPPVEKTDAAKPAETKAAPHFASLRAEKVNLRSGPSEDFPIQWVFQRRGLPVEIVASFDIWRKVHMFDGTEGWVHQQMLTGRRSVLITGTVRDLRHDPDPAGEIVAQLEPGVVAAMSRCSQTWCEVKAGGYKGWLKRDELWGVEPDEVVQ